MMKILRTVARAAATTSVLLLLTPVQLLIAAPVFRPVFRNVDAPVRHAAGLVRRIMGIRLSMPDGPLTVSRTESEDAPALYICNHESGIDVPLLKEQIDGAFVAKMGIENWPLVGAVGRSIGTIFIEKGKGVEGLPPIHRALAEALNAGRNVILFPQGTTDRNIPFKTGALSVLFDNLSDVKLTQPVQVRPISLRLVRVDGESVAQKPELQDIFSWSDKKKSFLRNMFDMFGARSMEIELRAFPLMEPREWSNVESFARAAEAVVRSGMEGRGQDLMPVSTNPLVANP